MLSLSLCLPNSCCFEIKATKLKNALFIIHALDLNHVFKQFGCINYNLCVEFEFKLSFRTNKNNMYQSNMYNNININNNREEKFNYFNQISFENKCTSWQEPYLCFWLAFRFQNESLSLSHTHIKSPIFFIFVRASHHFKKSKLQCSTASYVCRQKSITFFRFHLVMYIYI